MKSSDDNDNNDNDDNNNVQQISDVLNQQTGSQGYSHLNRETRRHRDGHELCSNFHAVTIHSKYVAAKIRNNNTNNTAKKALGSKTE